MKFDSIHKYIVLVFISLNGIFAGSSFDEIEMSENEADTLAKLRHEFILRFLDKFWEGDSFFVLKYFEVIRFSRFFDNYF